LKKISNQKINAGFVVLTLFAVVLNVVAHQTKTENTNPSIQVIYSKFFKTSSRRRR
jgi:predicted transcriptional regulator YdeE